MLRSANHKRATEPYLACQSTSFFRSAANMAIKTNRRTWRAVKFGPYKISVDRYICARARRPFPNPCMQKSPVFFKFYPCKSRVHGSLAKTLLADQIGISAASFENACSLVDTFSFLSEAALMQKPRNFTDDKSTLLIRVIPCGTTSHYLSLCLHISYQGHNRLILYVVEYILDYTNIPVFCISIPNEDCVDRLSLISFILHFDLYVKFNTFGRLLLLVILYIPRVVK